METTFITIHDLTRDARILYSSDSIVDILGHTPDEIVGKSCWEFFHPDEVPVAKLMHTRGVKLDKAAVLAYCNIRNRQGEWICCECCFSVVYDVMVCCTSIYRQGTASSKRAVEAPVVRRLFASSPKDPRYHMLTHLSAKFQQGPTEQTHEPRAALFLNRFTRTLTIMYATSGIEQIIGISGENMKGRSFYYCIQENCLEDAVRCLESAKGNDSIAYLRFFFRDPRLDDEQEHSTNSSAEDTDELMTDVTASEDETDHGGDVVQASSSGSAAGTSRPSNTNTDRTPSDNAMIHSGNTPGSSHAPPGSGTSSSDLAPAGQPSRSSLSTPSTDSSRAPVQQPIELEAVVSCTSDGLVVCLRRARPIIPPTAQPHVAAQPTPQAAPHYPRGLFAAPWAPDPVFVPALQQQQPQPRHAPAFPIGYYGEPIRGSTGRGTNPFGHYTRGPAQASLMDSIRDVAVFAWALTGINGCLEEYSRGKPTGDAAPHDGLPIWQPQLPAPPQGQTPVSGYASAVEPFGDPGLSRSESGSGSGHEMERMG